MLLFIAVFIGVFMLAKAANKAQAVSSDKKKSCPPHKWDYDETGFLICDTCKSRPGYAGRGSGGYE